MLITSAMDGRFLAVNEEWSRITGYKEEDIIGRRGDGTRESFTVRKISGGIGVERVFPLNSPVVDKVEVVRHGRVRRAKLYYLRELRGKATRIEERRVDRSKLASAAAAPAAAVDASEEE